MMTIKKEIKIWKIKKYQAPAIKVFKVAFEGNLLDWSAPKETGGGNVPEAKENDFFEEDDEDTNTDQGLPTINLWE